MDIFEKINRAFGAWYEGLFGGGDDVRPKDILRRILTAMEDHRKEGFDNRVYVPNQYILEIDVQDEEEKEYLLSFLERDELEAAIRRYCQQNHYHIRGPLDFTIKEMTEADFGGRRGEKVRVRCRYNTKITGPEQGVVEPPPLPVTPLEERTIVGREAQEESGTVPSLPTAALIVASPNHPPFRFPLTQSAIVIGRSTKSSNDLVLEGDGQVSKQHARLEREPDGRYTLYDLGSTNGTKVNGRRIDNRTLNEGDEIILGETRLTFQPTRPSGSAVQPEAPSVENAGVFGGAAAEAGRARGGSIGAGSSVVPPMRPLRPRTARLLLLDGENELDDYLLASETLIGRGVTNDIVLPDRSVATRHARIVHDGTDYTIENLANSGANAFLNAIPIPYALPTPLKDGDLIRLGNVGLRFDAGGGE